MFWGWGPGIWREAAASALIYCNPRTIVPIGDRARSPAPQARLLRGPRVAAARAICHGERSESVGLGAASSPLYGNKAERFLSGIWEKCLCREPCCEPAGQEGVKPCEPAEEATCSVGSQGAFLKQERFLPFSLIHPSSHRPGKPQQGAWDAAPLPFAGARLSASPAAGTPRFLPGTPPAPPSFAGASWLRHIQHPASPPGI